MKKIKKALIIMLSIIALLFIISVLLPSEKTLERSIAFKGNIDSVFNQINDLQNWKNWTVWLKEKEDIQLEYLGPKSGVAAMQQWKGEYGVGRIILMESTPPKNIKYAMRLHGYAPFYGSFSLKQNADSTITIYWITKFEAGNDPRKKYFCLFLETFMATDMEKSLNNLAALKF